MCCVQCLAGQEVGVQVRVPARGYNLGRSVGLVHGGKRQDRATGLQRTSNLWMESDRKEMENRREMGGGEMGEVDDGKSEGKEEEREED